MALLSLRLLLFRKYPHYLFPAFRSQEWYPLQSLVCQFQWTLCPVSPSFQELHDIPQAWLLGFPSHSFIASGNILEFEVDNSSLWIHSAWKWKVFPYIAWEWCRDQLLVLYKDIPDTIRIVPIVGKLLLREGIHHIFVEDKREELWDSVCILWELSLGEGCFAHFWFSLCLNGIHVLPHCLLPCILYIRYHSLYQLLLAHFPNINVDHNEHMEWGVLLHGLFL